MNDKIKMPLYNRTSLRVIRNEEWNVLHLNQTGINNHSNNKFEITSSHHQKIMMPELAHGYIKAKEHDCL